MAKPDLPENSFYCYALFDHRGVPFYIGKGKGYRAFHHKYMPRSSRNRYRRNILLKTIRILGDCPVVMIRDHISEPEAFELEKAFIKAIGRFPNGPLVNMTDGGEGVSGRLPLSDEVRARIAEATRLRSSGRVTSEETKRKLRAANLGHPVSEGTRAKISAARKGKPLSAEACANIRAASQNRGPEWKAALSRANVGKILSAETKAKIGAAGLGRSPSQATRDKIGAAHKGKTISAEQREAISKAHLGKPLSEEHKASLRAAQARIRTRRQARADSESS